MATSPQCASGPRCSLLLAAIGYAAGILFAQHCWRPRLWWLAAALALIAGATVFAFRATNTTWRGWVAHCCVLACTVALGALGYDLRWTTEPGRSGWESLTVGDKFIATGYVVRDGVLRGSGSARRQSIDFQLETIEPEQSEDRSTAPSVEHVRATRVDAPIVVRRKRARKTVDPCKVNAAWPAELLAASGLAGCQEKATEAALNTKQAAGPVPTGQSKRLTPDAALPRFAQGGASKNDESRPAEPASARIRVPPGAIRISIYAVDAYDSDSLDAQRTSADPPVFTYGQRLRFPVTLRPPRNFGNPGSLDYAGYLQRQGIYALGSVRADRIELLDGTAGSRWELWRSRVRRSVIARIHALWPLEQAGLLDAMLIGERSFIGRDTSAAFQRTGIYHILVVSGMNVGILAFVVFWTLRRVRCGEVLATLITVLLSCGYAYVAESGAPIVRSVVMLAIYLFTRLIYRERALLNALGAAALALMVADPRAVTDSSFQLTLLSVLAICGIAVPLIERTSQPYRTALRWLGSTDFDISLEPRLAQFRIDLRIVAARLARVFPRLSQRLSSAAGRTWRRRAAQSVLTTALGFLISGYELLVVSFITQIALALPMAWYFHRATVTGLPANLLAVPLTGVLMPFSVAAVALSYVSVPLARVPAWIASCAAHGITWTVEVLGTVSVADLRLATPDFWTAIASTGAFLAAVVLARKGRMLSGIGVAALCATALWMAVIPPNPQVQAGQLEITAIDVGQAESFLVVTPERKTLLVDAAGSLGPWQSEFDFGEDVIAPYLWSRGITRLDTVAVTHAHSDHYGGMASVLKIFRPAEMWVGPNAPDPGFDSLLQRANQQGIRLVRRSEGEAFAFGGAQVRVLAPASKLATMSKPKNDDSLVLWLGHGGTSALLEADAQKPSEREMLGSNLKSDLLKVAHNGSNSSSTPEFLAEVQPSYALISVGARNSFGHPRPEVLERLAAMHVRTYRTDLLGAVTFLLDGKEVVVKLPMMENR